MKKLLLILVLPITLQANVKPFDFATLELVKVVRVGCGTPDNLGVMKCIATHTDDSERTWYLKMNKQGQLQRYKEYPINATIKPVPFGTK